MKMHDDGKWKAKDVRDFDDGDVEKLYQQWEVSFLSWLSLIGLIIFCGYLIG